MHHYRIHVGAHKTATTHLQETLAVLRPTLRERGINYLPLDEVRPVIRRAMGKPDWHYRLLPWRIRRKLADNLEALRDGAEEVALSEENILGDSHHVLDAQPYPRLQQRIAMLAELRRSGARMTLFLSIRRFDRVLPGAYATALRFGTVSPAMLARLAAAVEKDRPSWIDVIERLHRAAPDVDIRVWRHDDYREHAAEILSAFLGRPVEALPRLPPPATTVTPSAAGVAKVESLLDHRAEPEWKSRVEAIYAAHPVGPDSPRYTFLDQETAARLADRYEADVAELRRRRPSMLIEPWRGP